MPSIHIIEARFNTELKKIQEKHKKHLKDIKYDISACYYMEHAAGKIVDGIEYYASAIIIPLSKAKHLPLLIRKEVREELSIKLYVWVKEQKFID